MFYNWHRDYNPALGRYVQSDPTGLQGGINAYVYANSGPLSSVDPQGLLSAADLPTLPQGLVDAVTGIGDGITILGVSPSRAIRNG